MIDRKSGGFLCRVDASEANIRFAPCENQTFAALRYFSMGWSRFGGMPPNLPIREQQAAVADQTATAPVRIARGPSALGND
jgi:hypothetical protein